ncbi:hypothetical protein ZWY2020_032915 [Hordeum vulgare]|nr:hypothetical protein ZWY2020_032915 [Hordeum vulgare]
MAGISAAATGNGKAKVVILMGATATGKSKLAVDIALRSNGEVVNSDKIQVHDGLPVVTNKPTVREQVGVPHHMIGGVHPNADYTAADFRRGATRAVESVLARGRLPIIAGGSNNYLEALLDGELGFRRRYDFCFLWVDAETSVLERYVGDRVDCMVEQGLVGEVREFFRADADYSRGIRRAIGVPEMDAYFRMEAAGRWTETRSDGPGSSRPPSTRSRRTHAGWRAASCGRSTGCNACLGGASAALMSPGCFRTRSGRRRTKKRSAPCGRRMSSGLRRASLRCFFTVLEGWWPR